jgi:hypothetical protein
VPWPAGCVPAPISSMRTADLQQTQVDVTFTIQVHRAPRHCHAHHLLTMQGHARHVIRVTPKTLKRRRMWSGHLKSGAVCIRWVLGLQAPRHCHAYVTFLVATSSRPHGVAARPFTRRCRRIAESLALPAGSCSLCSRQTGFCGH